MSVAPTEPVPAAVPVVPLPTPVPPERPGLWPRIVARFKPFACSVGGYLSGPEISNVIHNAIIAGTLAGLPLTILSLTLINTAPQLGVFFGPFAGLAVGAIQLVGQMIGRASDHTGPDGKPAAAPVLGEDARVLAAIVAQAAPVLAVPTVPQLAEEVRSEGKAETLRAAHRPPPSP